MFMEQLNIYDLAKAPLTSLSLLPADPGLYFAVDDSSRVWYVGLAVSLRDRLTTHDRIADFRSCGATHVAWEVDHDAESRIMREKDLIRLFDPPLNDLCRPGRKPLIALGRTKEEEIERFIAIKQLQSELDFELNQLKANIVTHCELNAGKIHLEFAKVFLSSRTTFSYSTEVESMAASLKARKKEEESNGSAIISSSVVFPVVRLTANAKIAKSK
jgi:hypothetical protein